MANEETDKCLCRGSGETLSAGIDQTDNRGRQLFGHVDHVGSVDPRPLSAFQPCRTVMRRMHLPDVKRDASAMSK